jgi:hypothetical protein
MIRYAAEKPELGKPHKPPPELLITSKCIPAELSCSINAFKPNIMLK